jgi:hypothetical protein
MQLSIVPSSLQLPLLMAAFRLGIEVNKTIAVAESESRDHASNIAFAGPESDRLDYTRNDNLVDLIVQKGKKGRTVVRAQRRMLHAARSADYACGCCGRHLRH